MLQIWENRRKIDENDVKNYKHRYAFVYVQLRKVKFDLYVSLRGIED